MITRRRFFTAGLCSAAAIAAAKSSAGQDKVPSSKNSNRPSAGDFDVVVIGGSCTGVFAAMRAAEEGCRTAIIEMSGGFGGTATQGFVSIWHSLYSTDGKIKIIGGLTDKIQNELIKRAEAKLDRSKTNPSVGATLNVAALQIALDDYISKNKLITPFLHTRLADAEVDGSGRITGVVVADKSGLRLIKGKFFIDATGDADLCRFAGLPVWRFPKDQLQAHTVCALVSGLNAVKARYRNFSFGEIMKPKYGADIKHTFGWGCEVVGSQSLFLHAFTRVSNADPSIPEDLTRIEMEGRAQLRRMIDAANKHFPMPQEKKLAIAAIAPHAGLRESCHIDSLYKTTAEDILYGRRFDDAIVRGSYRVDIHEGAGITFKYLDGHYVKIVRDRNGASKQLTGRWREKTDSAPTWYEIPYRSIVPKGSVNILAPGRELDCERDAYGACRVMVNCNQMGEAAGRAAAYVLKHGVAVADAGKYAALKPVNA